MIRNVDKSRKLYRIRTNYRTANNSWSSDNGQLKFAHAQQNPPNLHCCSRKYPYSPHRRVAEILERRGVSKTPKFKIMYGARLEFPEGWGGHRANTFRGGGGGGGGYGYFLEPHIGHHVWLFFFLS